MAAARLLLERVLPAIKAVDQPVFFDVPAGGLADRGEAVLAAVAVGEIAPDQAQAVLSGLAALAKLEDTDELERRIAALEECNETS